MKNLYFKSICLFLLVFNSYAQGNDVIFLIDNSGSVDSTEYLQMNSSIQSIIAEVLECNENNRISVVQYTLDSPIGGTPRIYIESDFSNTPMAFPRRFLMGTAQAHAALLLVGKALDNITDVNILGTASLNQNPANSLVIYLFTDDVRNGLVKQGEAIGSNAAFTEFTAFKNSRAATFVVTIVPPNTLATQAAAAIASQDPTGLYTGIVESYPADPDGPGVTPRFLLEKADFNLTSSEIENLTNYICSCSTSITGMFENSSANFQWDDTASSYIIEAIGNSNCNWPLSSPKDNLPSLYATMTITDNFFSPGTLAGLLGGTKELMWRIRTECGEWSDWCCYDGNGDATPTFSNGSCFYTDQPCEGVYNLNITQAVLSGQNVEEQASNILTAINVINNNATADYRAINQVLLQSGFHSKAGSLFTARIVDCDMASRPARERKNAKAADKEDGYYISNDLTRMLKITPNPSSSYTDISLDNIKMSTIVISSLDGRTMFSQNGNVDSYKLDVSDFNKGIYMVTVTTIDGEVISGKIVKK